MNSTSLASLVALIGWLILATAAMRSQRIGPRRAARLVVIWVSIFLAVALAFSLLQG